GSSGCTACWPAWSGLSSNFSAPRTTDSLAPSPPLRLSRCFLLWGERRGCTCDGSRAQLFLERRYLTAKRVKRRLNRRQALVDSRRGRGRHRRQLHGAFGPERSGKREREQREQHELSEQRLDAVVDAHRLHAREAVDDRDGHRAALLQLPNALAGKDEGHVVQQRARHREE